MNQPLPIPWAAIRIAAGYSMDKCGQKLGFVQRTIRRFERNSPDLGERTRNTLELGYLKIAQETATIRQLPLPFTVDDLRQKEE